MLFMIEDMVMSHGGSAVHLRSGSHAACKWTRYGPFRGSVSKAAILRGGFAVWVIYVVT